jgi:hypothetical protein
MLVKVNSIDNENKMINVTRLDIDDYGSVIPLEELELQLPPNNNSVIETLKNSRYAVLLIQEDLGQHSNIITSAETMTLDELNKEKQKTIEVASDKEKINSH